MAVSNDERRKRARDALRLMIRGVVEECPPDERQIAKGGDWSVQGDLHEDHERIWITDGELRYVKCVDHDCPPPWGFSAEIDVDADFDEGDVVLVLQSPGGVARLALRAAAPID